MPVNLNTANREELITLPNIGHARATLLLEEREKHEGLTWDILSSIQEIPVKVWHDLFKKGKVVLEPAESPTQTSLLNAGRDKDEQISEMQLTIQQMDTVIERLRAERHEVESLYETRLQESLKEFQEKHLGLEKREASLRSQLHEREQQLLMATAVEGEKDTIQQVVSKMADVAPGGIFGKGPKEKWSKPSAKLDEDGSIIKMPTYDGKAEWGPYQLQFNHIAARYHWSDQHKLDRLIESLREKALKFFSSRPVSVQGNFSLLCQKMEQRFGRKEAPHIVRRQLQELKQNPDETLEEYAERAQGLATNGFSSFPEEFVQMMGTDGFLRALQDKRAALTAMDKNPENLDVALDMVNAAVTNQRIILGSRGQRSEIKRVSFSDEELEGSVRSVEKLSYSPLLTLSWSPE